MTRRSWLACLTAAPWLLAADAHAEQRGRVRRRVRRRTRRRIRRRVGFRTVSGQRVLVVPLAVAAGWELAVDDRVLVVQRVQADSLDAAAAGAPADTLPAKIPTFRQDTPANSVEHMGSLLPGDDTTTPAIEVEETVDMEE